CQQQNSYPRTF
nr:immunoglobulin light chain junction region [Macaca mulatta]MOV61580.1 immunoglobulin light chain junction region [Macaca mulatta]MOV61598.1 immunoglobulin light chain junction region [Macaca mulatta]MOV61893.1 immunoglobulin light chain junction region [Macaca mulatta]MOV62296.1 immunoglobulin light chain junction region [Macaca mulatta]